MKYVKVVVDTMARNGRNTAIRMGGWGRFPIDNDICTFLTLSLFGFTKLIETFLWAVWAEQHALNT